jgi:hypothetical protein
VSPAWTVALLVHPSTAAQAAVFGYRGVIEGRMAVFGRVEESGGSGGERKGRSDQL